MKANQGVDISTTYLYRVGHMCWLVLEHVPACAWACAGLCLGMCRLVLGHVPACAWACAGSGHKR